MQDNWKANRRFLVLLENNKKLFSISVKISIMGGFLIICLLNSIIETLITVYLMIDGLIRMSLFNLYNILVVFCQICSVLPICMVFIITSKMKCLLCDRSNICCAGTQGQCPLLTSLCLLVALYFVLDHLGAVDPILSKIGYVKQHNTHNEKINATMKHFARHSADHSSVHSFAFSSNDPSD